MKILGVSAWYHDSGACLIEDGKIVAAVQEERFTRKKHDENFPVQSIRYCLSHAAINLDDVDFIVFYEKPFLKFERLFETYLAFAPKGFKNFVNSLPVWVKDKLFQKRMIRDEFVKHFSFDFEFNDRLLFSEHHLSHAASAFYPSPFEDAAVLTIDGVGEWTTTSLAVGSGSDLKILKEIRFPHSLGLLYSAFTYYTGFKVNSGEYKVMGLAPYGKPIYHELIMDNLIDVKPDGSFQLDMSYFDYCTGMTMTNTKFDLLFGAPRRKPESELTQREMDLAASVQSVTEEIVLRLARSIRDETGLRNLCLAGGVALNCVANGKIAKEGIFDNVWVQPAAGDAGGALGAALAAYYLHCNSPRLVCANDSMSGSYLGPSFSSEEISNYLDSVGAKYFHFDDVPSLIDRVSGCISEGMAVGWMQGRMEFGPRALGGRSIIADPRSEVMQKQLNLKIKFRESFRPFAPSVLEDKVAEWFDFEGESPYMLMVAPVSERIRKENIGSTDSLFGLDLLNVVRSQVPAITHVDYSARLQTVSESRNGRYFDLIKGFFERTGCPILVNTSFNVRGEPIVCSPEDAFRCFMGTELDVLVIDDFVLFKTDQSPSLIESYEHLYELD